MQEMEKMLVTSIFFIYHIVFYPVRDKFCHLRYLLYIVCKHFQFGEDYNLLFSNE